MSTKTCAIGKNIAARLILTSQGPYVRGVSSTGQSFAKYLIRIEGRQYKRQVLGGIIRESTPGGNGPRISLYRDIKSLGVLGTDHKPHHTLVRILWGSRDRDPNLVVQKYEAVEDLEMLFSLPWRMPNSLKSWSALRHDSRTR